MSNDAFIYGSDPLERIVSIEVQDSSIEIFRELADGTVVWEARPFAHWMLAPRGSDESWERLDGDNHYKFRKRFPTRNALYDARRRHSDHMVVYDAKESALVDKGLTYYKGMRQSDVSVLAFDIESTSLEHGPDARVLLISNTFRRAGRIERKLFAIDEYATDAAMFDAWSAWVCERDPSLVVGHNIYGYDLPYLQFCASRAGTKLRLGRDGSALSIPEYESKYRKDGSQFYTYRNAKIYGREIVDTFFLAMKYDIGRKYDNYRLKYLVAEEGLEVAGRVHYDGATIGANYHDPVEREKIKAYAIHDADDALALYDRMSPAYFYLNQSIPKSFQQIINGASGAWLNSFLTRSYLHMDYSIPKASDAGDFEGAISIGNPGIYINVFKVDVASLYPSIILEYGVHDAHKDEHRHFLKMVEHFTSERLANKRLARETGDRYYSDLEQAQKIVINSAYGLLGTPGLNFNSPANGALITRKGRELLTDAMDWATARKFHIVNADTDSISIAPIPDRYRDVNDSVGDAWPDSSRAWVLEQLNSRSPARIRWEDDGVYESVLVLKAKNYVMRADGKTKTKGSALKATLKEPALKDFINELVTLLLAGRPQTDAVALYNRYAREILTLTDINRWANKKTVTNAVLNSPRANETKVLDALEGSTYQMGDKFRFYYDTNEALKLASAWTGDHHVGRLAKKLHDTVKIFDSVLPDTLFLNYALKRNQKAFLGLVEPFDSMLAV